MLTAYLDAAMRYAQYDLVLDQPAAAYAGIIPPLPDVRVIDSTIDACRDRLRVELAIWVRGQLATGAPLPIIDGIDLNTPEAGRASRP